MEIIERPRYLNHIISLLGKDMIIILVGQRRVGKSYMLKQLQNWLQTNRSSSNIVYINKELHAFKSISSAGDLYEYAVAKLPEGGDNYLLIDEVQDIEGYEDAVFQIIPIPENSFGVRRAESYAKDLTDRFYAVNASSKNKEAVIKLIDWLYSDYGSDISNYGVEGYSFEYNEEGEPEFLLSYLEQFRDASPSSYYAVYEDLGVTKLNFCLYACNTRTWFEIEKALGNWDEVSDEYWNIVNNDDAYVPPKIAPALTTEESERSTDILMELTTVLEQEYNKYIMGIEPIENWDSVIAHCEELGARELEDIYNTALARTNAN